MSPPKHVDLLVLAAAAVVFVLADFPLLGYAAGASAWLAQRGIQWLAQRRSAEALKAGNRQRAMGIAERTAGLSSAVLLMALFTISMGSSGIAYLLEPEEQSVQPR
jgi:hypothetical protein